MDRASHTAEYDPLFESQRITHNLLEGVMWCKIWSRNPPKIEATKPSNSTVWIVLDHGLERQGARGTDHNLDLGRERERERVRERESGREREAREREREWEKERERNGERENGRKREKERVRERGRERERKREKVCERERGERPRR